MSVAGLVSVARAARPPGERFAGIPLLLRAVLVAKQAGLHPVRVVSSDPDEAREILSSRKLDDVEIVPALPGGPVVVLPHDVVCEPAVLRALAEAPGPALLVRGGEPLGPERLDAGAAQPTLVEVGDALAVRLDTPRAMQRARDALFEACRKPVDGIVSRHLNRHLSIFISKRLVDTPVSPNATTIATFFVGLLAAALVSRGGYGWTLAGAALLQCNSILDGVDGELARVRHQHSRLGQWLDTVSDDLVNVAFWAALGVGAVGLPGGRLLLLAGLATAGAHLLLACVYWVELVAIGSGDAYDIDWGFRRRPPQGLLGRALELALYVPKKDFFIFFCLVCALGGVLSQTLPLIAFVAAGTALAAVARALTRLAKGRAGWAGERS